MVHTYSLTTFFTNSLSTCAYCIRQAWLKQDGVYGPTNLEMAIEGRDKSGPHARISQ